jgi:hypothetical protein
MTESHHFLLPTICFLIAITAPISCGILSANSLPYQRANNSSTMTDGNKDIVFIEDVSTQPKTVQVGDNFSMLVTIINSSPNTIYFPLSKCLGKPVSLEFSSNNVKKLIKICKEGAPLLASITPGERSIVNSAIYKAVSAGSTEGIATIYYRVSNNGPFNIPASKAFSFQIHDHNRILP